jgi:flagellar hook-length control protein FliK
LNPALTTGLLKSVNSNEINALTPSNGALEGLSDELFASEFSTAMEDFLSANGKLKPLDLASLKGLDSQQLTELLEQNGIKLPPELLSEAIDLKQLPLNILPLEASSSIDDLNVVGHPDASALLKTNLINDDVLQDGQLEEGLLKEGLLNRQANKHGLFNKGVSADAIQQSVLKKEAGLPHILSKSDIDLSQYMKSLSKNDIDVSSELLTQPVSQEINTTKLVDQLASIDKPINAINSINNNPVQTYSNNEPSGMMLRRIEVPVQQAGWGEAVGNRLMMMVNDKMQSAHIHLNPPELGPIEVRVNVNQDQASVHFVSSNTAVRDAIEDAFPRLKEMFMQNGLSLTDANVSQQSPQQGNRYSSDQNGSATVVNNEPSEISDAQTENTQENSVDIGLIDHYV